MKAELKRQRREAWARLSVTMDALQAQFRADYGNLTDEEVQALIDQWVEKAHRQPSRDIDESEA